MGKYFSPGKLLLTSEYLVLDGALSLAIPTKLGQSFSINTIDDGNSTLLWEGFHLNSPWLQVEINYKNWTIISCNLPDSAKFILKVLQNVQTLSKTVLQEDCSYTIQTNLGFPANYGWGSSSTLMVNIANWSNIDPFILNEISLGGSGYDIAVAIEKSPILFQNLENKQRLIKNVTFQPEFSKDLILVHLNIKQDSREGISFYKSKEKSSSLIQDFSKLTLKILNSENFKDFSDCMEEHERKLSHFLEIPTVKERFFQDCPVFVKSLGAWGGDFILTSKFVNFKEYFCEKGFTTILDWSDVTDCN